MTISLTTFSQNSTNEINTTIENSDSKISFVLEANLITVGNSFIYSYYHYPYNIGIGISNNMINTGFTPLFIDFKYFVSSSKFSPFLAFDFGKSFIDLDKGYHINPYTGFRKMLNNRIALNYSIGIVWKKYIQSDSYSFNNNIYKAYPDVKIGISYMFSTNKICD